MEKQFDKVNLNELILNHKIPDGWDFAYQLTYNDLSKIIESMYALNQPSTSIANIVDLLTNHHEYVEVIRKKPSNFIRKIESKVNSKNAEHIIYLPIPELSTKDSCCPHSSVSLGPYCDKISFNINTIKKYETFRGPPYFKFTNGSIFEIGQYRQDRITWNHFTNLVSIFSGETKVSPQTLKNKFDAISNTQTNLLKKENKLTNYLNHAFQCQPQNSRKPPAQQLVTDNENNDCNATNETQVKLMQEEIYKLILTVLDLQSKLNLTCECLKEEIEKRSVSETSKHKLAVQLNSAKKERDTLKNKLTSCLNKLSHLSTRNVNKRLNKRYHKIQSVKPKHWRKAILSLS